MKRSSVQKTVLAALFAALIFVGTQFLRLPLAFGYFHLGDAFVLLAAYFVVGAYAAVASAFGSVLADVLSGYVVYAPATLIIKAAMALIVIACCRRRRTHLRLGVGVILAETFMIIGYFLFDMVLYGLSGAVVSLPGNALQGAAATVIGIPAAILLERIGIFGKR